VSLRRHAGAAADDGFVLVATLAVLVVLLVLGTAAVTAALSSMHSANASEQDMEALEGAEAAADMGWNRLNLVSIDSLGLSITAPCLSWSLSGDVTALGALAFGSNAWCPSVSVPVPGTSSASYQVTELTLGGRSIVGTATVGSVTRRIELMLNQTTTGTPIFGSYGLESKSSLDLPNSTEITGAGVRSDGSIELQDTAVACHVPNGSITPGPGMTVTETNNAGTCGNSTSPAAGDLNFPAITVPTSSNDSRICVAGEDPCHGTVTWNPLALTLNLQNTGDTVTLTGNTYVFCSMTMMNGTLNIDPSNGKAVQIYFLPPIACVAAGMTVGSTDLQVQNTTADINNETGLGAAGLQIYLEGDNTVFVNNQGSTAVHADIYAPTGRVELENSATVDGAVAANAVTMTAQATINWDSSSSTVTGGAGSILYGQSQYVECTPSASSGAAPDQGCP
jgi:Tfp pilus assembly protein PilX